MGDGSEGPEEGSDQEGSERRRGVMGNGSEGRRGVRGGGD